MSLRFEDILPLILALILIFLIPVLASRRGMSYGEYVKSLFSNPRKSGLRSNTAQNRTSGGILKKDPVLFNSRKNELTELVSTLLVFARRHKVGLVYPGTMDHNGEKSTILCFIVTGNAVFGVNCFGYAGMIKGGLKDPVWKQSGNGAEEEIPNPHLLNEHQYRLTRAVLEQTELRDIPLRIIGVFTNRDAMLSVRGTDDVMTTKQFLEFLQQRVQENETKFDPDETARKLHALTTPLKKEEK